MGRWIAVIFLAAAVALAVVVGQRMSTEAMAVVIGVVVGVVAGVPTGLMVLAVVRARREERPPTVRSDFAVPPPQVYIVQPPSGVQPPAASGPPSAWLPGAADGRLSAPYLDPPALRPARRFRVVGDDDRWLDEE